MLAHIGRHMGPELRTWCDPEDVLHDALVLSLVARAKVGHGYLRDPEKLVPWILAVARNHIRSLARGNRPFRRSAASPTILLALEQDQPDSALAEPDGRPREPAERGALDHATDSLARLTTEQRMCVILRDLHGLPLATTAFVLRRSRPATAKLHQRARARLYRLRNATPETGLGGNPRTRTPPSNT